jgi:hypothetical protein
MRIRLKFVLAIPENLPGDVVVSYGETLGIEDGSKKLYEVFQPSGLFYKSECSGINFKKRFDQMGININNYYQVSLYDVSANAAKIVKQEISKYPWIKAVFPKSGLKQYFKNNDKLSIFEFSAKNSSEDMVIFFGPESEDYELNVLHGLQIYDYTFNVPNEAGIDYLTKDSIYITDKDELTEICSLLLNDQIPQELQENIDCFVKGRDFAMWDWGSIDGRNEGIDFSRTPWKLKLLETKEKLEKISENKNMCFWEKICKMKKILKQ